MISIIIINYFQKELTKQCVQSIKQNLRSYPVEIIVINNSPTEDLVELQTKFENVTIIPNENRGYSQANNLGASLSSGEYLFFLNADTIIKSDFLETFLKEFSDKKFGAAGLKLYNTDETFQLSFWKENTFLNEITNKNEEKKFRKRDINFISKKEKEFTDTTEVDWVTGAAMVIRKKEFKEAGGFDENYFLYYEDADICKTFKKKGYKNFFFPGSNIVHYKGENVNRKNRNDSYYYSKKSQLYYYKKNNDSINNIALRLYLISKTAAAYLLTFNRTNLKILKMVCGMGTND
ncbi:MAG: glycosyltransferase family 2 protein [bacterium]